MFCHRRYTKAHEYSRPWTHKEESPEFSLSPPIISNSVGGTWAKLVDCQESFQILATDWSRTSLQGACNIQQLLQWLSNHNLATSTKGFSPLLKQLLTNAKANIDKEGLQAKRHNAIIKIFYISLNLCRSMGIRFSSWKYASGITFLQPIQRAVSTVWVQAYWRGWIQIWWCCCTLKELWCQNVEPIAEDATSVIAKADYDYENDRVVVFVLPYDDTGLPISETF